MKFTLEKGRGAVTGEIANEKILETVTGRDIPALDHGRVNTILARGIRDTAPPDIAGKKVAVIIPDDTRLWARGDLFVPGIVRT